ncbi:MAG: DUF5908 family protein [Bacteroidota bacterium]
MPIEIREVVIKAQVEKKATPSSAGISDAQLVALKASLMAELLEQLEEKMWKMDKR